MGTSTRSYGILPLQHFTFIRDSLLRHLSTRKFHFNSSILHREDKSSANVARGSEMECYGGRVVVVARCRTLRGLYASTYHGHSPSITQTDKTHRTCPFCHQVAPIAAAAAATQHRCGTSMSNRRTSTPQHSPRTVAQEPHEPLVRATQEVSKRR